MNKSRSGSQSWRVGSVQLWRVEENVLPLPTKVLVPDITVEQIDAQRPWVDPYFEDFDGDEPILRLSIHSFVIRSAETTIVVDTCVGPDQDRGLKGDPDFLPRLAAAIDGGLEAVDYVVCTHLHFDHVGWNTVDVDGSPVPAFPNARYLITAPEMAELERDDDMDVRDASIQPLIDAEVLDVVDVGADGYDITPDVSLLSTPGHTPGHVSVLIRSTGAGGEESGLITGDAFHSPLQFAYPELAAWRFDSDSAQSTETRNRMLARFTEDGTMVFGTHFAPPTAGLIRRSEIGVWFEGI